MCCSNYNASLTPSEQVSVLGSVVLFMKQERRMAALKCVSCSVVKL